MKNVINYFYNFNIDNIRMIHDDYYFIYQNNKFIFQEIKDVQFDYQAIYELNKLLLDNNKCFYRIILNKDNNVITVDNNKRYILMIDNALFDREIDFLDILDTNILINDNSNKIINRLNRFHWSELWANKIDYFERFINHNINNYHELNKYANYFIGMGENAISYATQTIQEVKPANSDNMIVSHKRINQNMTLKQLYNPTQLVIDHPSRDFSEYLKMIFFRGNYKTIDINVCIDELSLSYYGARLLLARMLFPSFFFDKFEELVENKISEKELLIIIEQMNDYEEYLQNIYHLLRSRYNIPEIEWLKKVDYSSTLTTPNTSGTSFINIDSTPSFNVTSIMLQ